MNFQVIPKRAPLKDAFPRIEFHFSNSIFGPRKELPAGNGDCPSRRHLDRDGARNRAGLDSHNVPFSRATGSPIRAAKWGTTELPRIRPPGCSEACLGSCTISTQETRRLTCQHLIRDSGNGPRDGDSLSRARPKRSARNPSQNNRQRWSGVRTTFAGGRC